MKDDITELRRAFPADDLAFALRAISRLLRTLGKGDSGGLEHGLAGWLRVKLTSTLVDHADLRIIYRIGAQGIELRAFGHRHDLESVYFRAANL